MSRSRRARSRMPEKRTMTSPPDPDPGGPLPQPRVRRRWHRLRPVWIVPIVALVLTGWLGWRTLSQRGPEITITFLNAQGVEAGRTRIQRNSLDLGIVEQVDPSPDLSHAIVRVRMSHIAE